MTAFRGCICAPWARRWGEDGACASCGKRVHEDQLIPRLLVILTGGTGLILWRNPRGFDERTKQRFGLAPGAADYIGIYRGLFVAIEFKTERGKQRPEQREFEALVTRAGGGIYAVVRSEADARALLDRLKAAAGDTMTK